ncbi:transposase [Bradyrhizobium sp. CCGB12]|uniref:transposase n=1 Tax=Bradyrhizobium sp. CCGB12 TaxID=2949632 RepID=UPI0035BFEA31
MGEDFAASAWGSWRSRRSAAENRPFVNGCLWVLRSGAHWCDLPERYGKWRTVHQRFNRWCHAGVWERVFSALSPGHDNQYLMIDSTIVRAHQQATSGKGGQRSGAGALPRRTDQDPHAGRCARPSAALHRHGWTG